MENVTPRELSEYLFLNKQSQFKLTYYATIEAHHIHLDKTRDSNFCNT